MGIPSYYRKLKDSVPGLVTKNKSSTTKGLYFDFNCLVYHVLTKDSVLPYPPDADDDARIAWENSLIECVLKYVRKIIGIVSPTEEVLISVDGVVPFAKMKQQRLRRFKSALSAAGKDIGGVVTSWDRNSITPGTYFMERLGKKLAGLGESYKGLQFIVQDASMPGEGEQKIMAHLRSASASGQPKDDIVIYGLDADLIVLSLLLRRDLPNARIHLFRENIEFGEMIYDALGEETFNFFDINLLETHLVGRLGGGGGGGSGSSGSSGSGGDQGHILDYAMAMTFLGNDFLPHGLSQKMSEEGHDTIVSIMSDMLKSGKRLMNEDTTWNVDGVREILQRLSLTEYNDMLGNIRKKLLFNPPIREGTGADFYPAEKVEYDFFEDGGCGGIAQLRRAPLKKGWQKTYYQNYVGYGGASVLVARAASRHYFEGLHWIRGYYLGEQIAFDWYYPFLLPPLWTDLLKYLDTYFAEGAAGAAAQVTDSTQANNIPKPQEQLAMVLPLESWWLIRDSLLRSAPYKAPQFWPSKYKLFSCGKKYMWECEAQIPLVTLRTLRRILA